MEARMLLTVYRVGTRKSQLAVIQTEIVLNKLREKDSCQEFEVKEFTTRGDVILDRPLDGAGGKGLFIEELDRAILASEIDFAVHSLKDMPSALTSGIVMAAFCERLDPRDALVLPKGKGKLVPGTKIGCSGRRRAVRLGALYPDNPTALVRGNVLTRLEKLDAGLYGALVLAGAGLVRLGLEGRVSRYFSDDELLCAAGQGITCVTCAENDLSTRQFVSRVDNQDARLAAAAERSFTRNTGGGCGAPVAAHAVIKNGCLVLKGWRVDEAGKERQGQTGGPCANTEDADALGAELAQRLKL
jgi:hydroxymethylbilane synthase